MKDTYCVELFSLTVFISILLLLSYLPNCTGEFCSNRGAMDSPTHGDKTHDGHSWGPSFDHAMDNDSLWNFGHKVGLCSFFLASCHTVMLYSYSTI